MANRRITLRVEGEAPAQSEAPGRVSSPEEEYFFRLNEELLMRRRTELDAIRQQQESETKKVLHWMHCPKCGCAMREMQLTGIYVDQCSCCQGVYFDAGELETLIESVRPKVFLKLLKRFFGPTEVEPKLF